MKKKAPTIRELQRFLNPTDRAKANWAALDWPRQCAAVAWSANYLQERLRLYKGQIGRGVLSIGHGAREVAGGKGRKPQLHKDPVLIVVVEKRFLASYHQKTKRNRLPLQVQLTVPVAVHSPEKSEPEWFFSKESAPRVRVPKRRIVLALPVTFVVHGKVKAHAGSATAGVQKNRLLVRGETTSAGTACALVKIRRQTTKYVMSCHHVVWNSKNRPGASQDKKAMIWSAARNSTATNVPAVAEIGQPWGPPLAKTRIDAAIVWLTEVGEQTVTPSTCRYWRVRPTGFLSSYAQWIPLGTPNRRGFKLYPWGSERVLDLNFFRDVPNAPIDYGANTVIKVRRALIFHTSSPTQNGYSGSPVVYRTKTGAVVLIGMHIAGAGNLSYVLPAYLFMSPGGIADKGFYLA